MKRVSEIILLFIGALLLFTTGCASGPEAGGGSAAATPPDWVLNPPEADDQYVYFTGSGTSSSGSLAEAEEAARGGVLDEIMRYLGVRITSETTANPVCSRASARIFRPSSPMPWKEYGDVRGL